MSTTDLWAHGHHGATTSDRTASDPFLGQVGDGVVGPWRLKVATAIGASSVVVRDIFDQDGTEAPFTEDHNPVGDLGPDRADEPLRVGVRPRSSGRDRDRGDAGVGEDRVEGRGELPGPVADQEVEVGRPVTEVHQEVPDLLGGPRSVRVAVTPWTWTWT